MTAAVAHSQDALDRWGARVTDRANPIVVKEIRQGLRTKVFWVFFALMLLACVSISVFALAASSDGSNDAGQGAFIAFFVCLAGVQFFVIPYTAYRSMAREAEDETWVLLTLTGLGPRAILMGKVLSFFLQGLLYSSAAAPFLLFSYYLNGIDLPTILVSMVMAVAYQLFLTSVGVCAATLADSRIVRALIHFLLLGALLWGTGMGIGGGIGLSEEMHNLWSEPGFALGLSAALFLTVSTAVLLFEAAAARLSLASENYARGPRLAFAIQFLGGVALFAWGYFLAEDVDVLQVGAVLGGVYLLFVGGFIASDVDGMRRNHFSVKARRQFLKPGALRGFGLVVLMELVSLVVFMGLCVMDGHGSLSVLSLSLASPLYSLLFLSLPIVLSRLVPHHPSQAPVLARLFGVAVFLAACGVPPLIGAFGSDPGNSALNVLNPIFGLVNIGKASTFPVVQFVVVGAAAVISAILAFITLQVRDREPIA